MLNLIGGLIDSLSENRVIRTITVAIVVTVVIAAIVALVVAGIGIASILLLVFLVLVSIYFGSIRVLSGSALLAILLQVVGGTIEEFVNAVFAGPEARRFFAIVRETGFFRLTLAFFFFFYLLSFGTRSINLFRFENRVNVENKVGGNQTGNQDDAEQEPQGRVVESRRR